MTMPDAERLVDAIAEAVLLADPADPGCVHAVVAAVDEALETGIDAARTELAACAEAARALKRSRSRGARAAALQRLATLVDQVRAALPRHDQSATDETEPDPATQLLAADPSLIADFVSRASEHADEAERHLLALDRNPRDTEAVAAAFRAFHTVKGMAGFLALDQVQTICHDAESVLDAPRHGEADLHPEAVQSLLDALDALREAIGAVQGPARTSATSAERTGPGAAPVSVSERRTIRVDEQRLDRLLDAIGELVVAQTMFRGSIAETVDAWGPVAQRMAHLDKITRELQSMATSLRMVPLRPTVRKLARLVRDLAKDAGKDIVFTASGEDTELDRVLVDVIADALVHLVRNAIDHGIEPSAERVACGKTPEGNISLAAFQQGGALLIELADDGRGIDPARVTRRAQRLGLIDEGAVLTEREAFALLMEPGFSTAEQVTSVSGRGVGMDAVRRAIEDLRGQVEITSDVGAGTTVRLRVPLTLAVMDGMVLRVGSERYIVPTAAIVRSVRPTPADLVDVLGEGTLIRTEGGAVPLVSLARLFGVANAADEPTEGIVTVVSDGDKTVALAACELLGQQQVVVKPLGDAMRNTPGIAGGAVMPDGTVGLIADVAGLIGLVSAERG